MWEGASSTSYDAAVFDVGSNSVRLVIYRVEGRAIWTEFNEKVLAGLGRDLTETRRLSPAGVEVAMAALRRVRAVLDGVAPAESYAAAVAGLAHGGAFAERVR